MKLTPDTGAATRGLLHVQWAVELTVIECFLAALSLIPAPLRLRMGHAIGRLVFHLDRRHRAIALENLRLAYPDAGSDWIGRTARKSFENLGRLLVELLRVDRDADRMTRLSEITGLEHLEQVTSTGRGYFLTSAHFGNWEFAAYRQGQLGHPVSMVARPLDNPWLEKRFRERRQKTGNRIIPKRQAVREIMRELRAAGGIALIIDQNFREGGAHFVDFFGREAATAPTLGMVAARMQVPILPLFAFPNVKGGYRLEYGRPIPPPETRGEDAARQLTAEVTRVVEEAIRRQPEAWFWMHRRWKTRPDGGTPQ